MLSYKQLRDLPLKFRQKNRRNCYEQKTQAIRSRSGSCRNNGLQFSRRSHGLRGWWRYRNRGLGFVGSRADETEASVSSALEPILDNEETDVANESGNVNDDPLENVCEICGGVDGQHEEGCSANQQPENTCPVCGGVDGQHEEGCSANQQPENTCPVCGGVDGQHEEGCSANQQPENTCPVCGGVDGQHEEGCSANQQPDEGDSGETTCPECGGVDGQHEENCSLAQESDNTPSEEDVAAAKNVSDLIGALPEASTLDPETTDVEALTAQVKAAREAYDKLTDAQKALVEKAVLDKLVALEGALEGLEQAETIPGDDVAQIGDKTYATLDEAVEEAPEGSTITLLKDCELTKGFNKTLTFNGGHKITINKQLTSDGEGWMCFGLYNPSRVLTFDGVEVEWNSEVGTAPWLMLSLTGTMNVTNGAHVKFTVDSGSSGTRNAIYMNAGSSINVTNGSTFEIHGNKTDGKEGQGIQLDQTGAAEINVTGNSTFLIDGTNRGYVNSPTIYVEDSKFTVQNCTANASNGGNFTAINSKITYYKNAGHGLSASNLTVQNSTLNAEKNGYRGISINGGNFSVDSTSTLNVTGNSYNGDYAGLKLTSGSNGLVESGATVNITGNYCSGLSNNGKCVFEDGVKLTITGNKNSQGGENGSHGGGIYNSGASAELTLPSDAVIYNNHALTDGDDIFNNTTATITFGKVGEGWTLEGTRLVSENKTEEECGHAITGWFDDSANNRWNVHTGPVHAELYNEFDETTGLTTITGLKALKAAHPYQYDPDAPTEPSEPVDWETSKSKTATNLDKNYESQVTLSLPAKDEQLVSDVVFVLDKSTSTNVTDEIKDMLDSLAARIAETDGAAVNVGVVSFNQTASIELPLTRLTADNLEEIKTSMDSLEQISGTNMNAGLLAGKEMLDNDTDVDASRKYMIIVSDGISYYYCKGTDYKTAYTIASLNGGDDGNGNKNCQPNSGASCFEIKYGATNIPNWIDWYADMPGLLSSEYSTYEYNVDDPNLPSTTDLDSKGAIPYADRQNYPINVDISLYSSYNLYQEMLAEGYHCYSVFGREDNGVPYAFGPSFMEYMGGDTYLGESGTTAFETIENDIFYLLDAGSSVIDVIGGDDNGEQYDYDFDFVNDLSKITLTVNGVEKVGVKIDENHYGFGERINYEGQEVYEYELTYYPNGLGVATMAFENEDVVAGELFRWDIYVPVKQFEPVQLTYTVKLANPQTTEGNYGQYDEDGSENYAGLYTNNSAVLFPVDSNGNVGEKEAFDKPTVSYTVGSNDHPGTDPTPDPDPDPDRPSRPSRDDDDDWEPLPDAPVKDKPTTEVDVPEETETPTTEQPDKYNPETGDTTTVFAAMALAAVSLGGVVLLGRKKK